MDLRYAIIGCGRIAANHIKAAYENGFDIEAACDIVPGKSTELISRFNISGDSAVRTFTDYHEMLHDVKPELVSIATDSGSHAKIASDCIKAGIPVIIEKPIAMSLADVDMLIRLAEEKNVKVAACHQNRFNVAVRELRAAVDAGRFGKLSHGTVHVRWNRGKEYYSEASWRGTWEKDGGALLNQCLHGIDMLRWMMGDDIEEIYGLTRNRFHASIEAEDVGLAVLKFRSGAIATIEGTVNVFPENLEETLYVFGEKGTAKLGGKSMNDIGVWRFADDNERDKEIMALKEQTANIYGNGHVPLFADMASAIAEDSVPYVDIYAGRRALETVLAIYKSMKENNPVKLPLNNFSTTEMEGMF